jgi:hypothetical protein
MRVPALALVATLVVGHGLVQGLPHTHSDHSVPQELLDCRASHPFSKEAHLHSAGKLMTQHVCLACLAGSIAAAAPAASCVGMTAAGPPAIEVTTTRLRSQLDAELPLLRGPPVIV